MVFSNQIVTGQNLNVYDKTNHSIDFKKSESKIAILKNNKHCLNCFTELYTSLKEIKCLKLSTISLIDSSVFARKRENSSVKSIMNDIQFTYFQYINSINLFDYYNVNITPAIIVIHDNKTTYIPYKLLFANKSLNKDFIREALNTICNK